jgi:hypothetical protein
VKRYISHLIVHHNTTLTLAVTKRIPREGLTGPPIWVKTDCASSYVRVLVRIPRSLVGGEIDAEVIQGCLAELVEGTLPLSIFFWACAEAVLEEAIVA